MIITKKHIAAVIIVIFSAAIAFGGIKRYESRQTFADNNLKIIVDAGHRAFV